MLPVSKFVIYHESKTGPFLKKNDSILYEWCKKLTNNKSKINNIKKEFSALLKNYEKFRVIFK